LAGNKKIEIIKLHDGIDIDKILFIPEVFTTLIHNSMKYAFKEDGCAYFFKIEIAKINDAVLDIRVSDNGKPDRIGVYKLNPEERKGLSILEQRVAIEFLLSKHTQKIKSDFCVEGIADKGVHVTFKFPYAEKTQNINS